MTTSHPDIIPFASGRLTADLGHHLIYGETGGYHRITERRFRVLELLAIHLNDTVPIDALIDATAVELTSPADRFRQRIRIGSYVGGLRKTFNQLAPLAGDIEFGALQTIYGEGFMLVEYWQPTNFSTATGDFLT
jgi:DNA-binding response OmpR family regulator